MRPRPCPAAALQVRAVSRRQFFVRTIGNKVAVLQQEAQRSVPQQPQQQQQYGARGPDVQRSLSAGRAVVLPQGDRWALGGGLVLARRAAVACICDKPASSSFRTCPFYTPCSACPLQLGKCRHHCQPAAARRVLVPCSLSSLVPCSLSSWAVHLRRSCTLNRPYVGMLALCITACMPTSPCQQPCTVTLSCGGVRSPAAGRCRLMSRALPLMCRDVLSLLCIARSAFLPAFYCCCSLGSSVSVQHRSQAPRCGLSSTALVLWWA